MTNSMPEIETITLDSSVQTSNSNSGYCMPIMSSSISSSFETKKRPQHVPILEETPLKGQQITINLEKDPTLTSVATAVAGEYAVSSGPASKGTTSIQNASAVASAASIFPCPMCVAFFVSNVDMKAHLEAEHRKYKCDICNKLMSHKRNVDRHRKSVHENQRGFGCPMCSYKSAHKQVRTLKIFSLF